jgi:hypothetical protein
LYRADADAFFCAVRGGAALGSLEQEFQPASATATSEKLHGCNTPP